ncbi:glycosyltransferase family 9 protein [bacterium]|nr:glycosyltransferase family 9 protein [bacterium]
MQKNNIKKLLIIRTGAIGDVVHTTALFRAIKKYNPQIIIHYLTSELIKPLLIEDRDIEKVLTINPKFKMFSSYTKDLANTLKQEKYDAVINLQPSLKIKYLMFLAKIKKQAIYRKNFKIHAVTNFWKTGLKFFPELKEEKELKLYLPKEYIDFAKDKTKEYKRPFIIINAGGVLSKRQGRTYPVAKWVELGNKLQKKFDGTIILNGAKEDKEILSPLNEIKNSVNLIGELPLINSCAVIGEADLMLSGDSGPLHIATALGVKSIGLYGAMPEKRTGCFSSGINIVSKKSCVPCNRRKCKYLKKSKKIYAPCMEEITTDEIIKML